MAKEEPANCWIHDQAGSNEQFQWSSVGIAVDKSVFALLGQVVFKRGNSLRVVPFQPINYAADEFGAVFAVLSVHDEH